MRRGVLLLGLMLVSLFLLNGCFMQTKKGKAVEVVKEVKEKRIPTEDEVKEDVLKQLKDEVRIYDVVAYQDIFQEKIATEMKEKKINELESVVEWIVKEYLDAHWEERVRELLSLSNDLYEEEDVQWVLERLSTKDLYRLIVLYESAFYKQNHQ